VPINISATAVTAMERLRDELGPARGTDLMDAGTAAAVAGITAAEE
jgi:hypothetical protein